MEDERMDDVRIAEIEPNLEGERLRRSLDYVACMLASQLENLAAQGHLDLLAGHYANKREQDEFNFRQELCSLREFRDRRLNGCSMCGFKGYGGWLRIEVNGRKERLCEICTRDTEEALAAKYADRRQLLANIEEDEPQESPSWVYFARSLIGSPLIKIGTSINVPARMKSLHAEAIFTLEGGIDLESDLHERFAQYREHGEWFRNEGELADFIDRAKEEE